MSDKINYLVTLATGSIGNQVARQLLDKGCNVRVMARTRSAAIDELVSLGAEVTLGHMHIKEDLDKALKGINRVFYCHTVVSGLLHNTMLFATAAKAAGVTTVINIGQYLASLPTHPSRTTQEHKQSYPLLDMADIGAIHVTPGFFADNVMRTQLFISQLGKFPFPLGKGKCPWVSDVDIAAVSVALLTNPAGHVGKHYQPTGPKSLSTQDLLDSFSRVLGRKVSKLPLPNGIFWKACAQMGMNAYSVSQFQFYVLDFQNNVFDYAPTDVVEKFTGRPAEDFDTTARRYFEKSGMMESSFSGKMEAIKTFIQIGTTKAPTPAQIDLLNQ